MARRNLQIGDRVTVYSFGEHPGVVVGFDPLVTVQGRTSRADGWVKVRTDSGLEWNGERGLLRFGGPRVRKAA
jgi:hypothetical protein